MIDNKCFPAMVEPNGAWRDKFIREMCDKAEMVSEGKIELPFSKGQRSTVIASNPVAVVLENKSLLHDILTVLIGLVPEGSAFYSKTQSQSSHQTRFYRNRKGVFGHALTALGVTEDHRKGHLHWHIVLMAGLLAYALQRFSDMGTLCKEISRVLNQMYCTQAEVETQLASII
jgi:hypothetical protein